MAMTLEEISDTYFSDSKVEEVTDREEIKNMLESKSASCWGSGQVISDGWVQLCYTSTPSSNIKQTVFICRSENLPA